MPSFRSTRTTSNNFTLPRDQRSAPYNNALFGVGGGRGRGGGRARGRGGFDSGRGAFGRGPGGPPPKGRNAPYGSYLTSYRKDDNRNSGYNSLSGQSGVYDNRANTLDRRQTTIDKVHNDLRANHERSKLDGANERAQNTETRKFGSTTMLAPAPRKAGQQFFSNVRPGKTLAQCGIAILSKHLNSALASSKFSICFTSAAMTHSPNKGRVWY